jgi:hypothetical protein
MGNRKTDFSTTSLGLKLCFLLLSLSILSSSKAAMARLTGTQAENYYPLDVGNSLRYQLSIKQSSKVKHHRDAVAQEFTLILTNLLKQQLHGKEVTPVKAEMQTQNRNQTFFNYEAEDENGIYLFAKQGFGDIEPKLEDSVNYEIKNPVRVGNTWEVTMGLMFGHAVPAKAEIVAMDDVVEVPAGTFQQCLKIRTIETSAPTKNGSLIDTHNAEHYDWYAPSVGLVKSIHKDNEVTMSAELQSFKK